VTVGEWDERQLCADGACIGLIGPSGTCKVCGRAAPNWGDERKRGLVADATPSDDDQPDGEGTAEDAVAVRAGDPERVLCPDGACIGVIGDDGRCKVCGKVEQTGGAKPSEADAAPGLDEPEAERKLCPDGACVGVIGPNGTCKVCGKAAE